MCKETLLLIKLCSMYRCLYFSSMWMILSVFHFPYFSSMWMILSYFISLISRNLAILYNSAYLLWPNKMYVWKYLREREKGGRPSCVLHMNWHLHQLFFHSVWAILPFFCFLSLALLPELFYNLGSRLVRFWWPTVWSLLTSFSSYLNFNEQPPILLCILMYILQPVFLLSGSSSNQLCFTFTLPARRQ